MHVTKAGQRKKENCLTAVFTLRALPPLSPSVSCILAFVSSPGFILSMCVGNTFAVLYAHFPLIIIFYVCLTMEHNV
jgi:hypothetical protein